MILIHKYYRMMMFSCIIVLFSLLVSGCGGFFTNRLQDMNAYFNTFYNASQEYTDATLKINQMAEKDRNPNRFIRIAVTSDVQSKFDSVIEKCSKVLQYYPQSVYFDDAMLMIGNSYYYSSEYFRAERKYIELRQNFPDGSLFAQATIGLAKTYYQMKKFPDAFEVLGDSITLCALNDDNIIAEGFFLKGQMFYEKKDFENAEKNFHSGLLFAKDNLLTMQLAFQLAQLYENQKQYEKAAEAYYILVDDAKDYILKSKASIRYAAMLSIVNRCNQALDFLVDLRSDRRNKDFFPSLDYEIGHILQTNGDFDLAEEQYVFTDSTYKHSDASAKANFQLAKLNEVPFNNFALALKYYSKAKGEFANSEITDSAKKKSEVFSNYFTLRTSITNYDSLINLKQHPELIGILDSIKRTEKAKADSIAKVRSDSINAYVSDSLSELGITSQKIQDKNNVVAQILEEKKNIHIAKFDSLRNDTLNLKNIATTEIQDSTDSIKISIKSKDSNKTLSKLGKDKNFWDEAEQAEDIKSPEKKTDSLLAKKDSIKQTDTLKISTGPKWMADTIKTPLADLIDSAANKEYELGLLMLNKMGLRDSGMFYLKLSLNNAPKSFQAPKVLFALSEYYLSLGDSMKPVADSLLRMIVDDFPTHPHSIVARRALGLAVLDTVHVDSVQLLYSLIERSLLNGNIDSAFKALYYIINFDTTVSILPQSYYSLGWIYENVFDMPDSAASCYKTLIQKFPTSEFSKQIQHKVSGVEGKDSPYSGAKKFRTDPLSVNISFDRTVANQTSQSDNSKENLFQNDNKPDEDNSDSIDKEDEQQDSDDEPP